MIDLFNLLIILVGSSMLYVSFTYRLEEYIKTLSTQGFLFFLIILLDFDKIPLFNFIFLIIETLIFKTIIIPIFLSKILRKNNINREVEPYIPNYYSVIIATLVLAFGFFISYWSNDEFQNIKPLFFGVSISVIINSFIIIITRKKIITHVIGYMFLENGIFLLSLSIAAEMPIIVNLGMLLDIFVGIFLLGIFVNKISSTFEELNIDKLTTLKD